MLKTTLHEFKQTEIGEIPADWDVKKLRDIADTASGGTPSRIKKEYFSGNVPWVKSGELKDGVILGTEESVSEEAVRNSSAKKFPKGTLLIALYGATVGKTAVLGLEAATNQAVCAIFPKDNIISSGYLQYFLMQNRPTLIRARYGGAQPNISQQIIQDLLVVMPSKPEQERIAGVLFKIQKAVESQEKIVADLRALKAATIAKLFREGLSGESLKQTEIGEIPKSWQLKALTACCEKPQYGYTESSSERPIGPKFLRITDLTENGVDWATVPYCKCSETDFIKHQLKAGDILVARIGATTGKNHLIVNCPNAVFASYLIRLRAKPDLAPEFLSNFMDSDIYWKQVRATKGQNLKGGMSGAILSQILMPFPSEPEQKEISDAIAIIDRNITYAVEKHLHAKVLFSSTLNQLMTGKVRILY